MILHDVASETHRPVRDSIFCGRLLLLQWPSSALGFLNKLRRKSYILYVYSRLYASVKGAAKRRRVYCSRVERRQNIIHHPIIILTITSADCDERKTFDYKTKPNITSKSTYIFLEEKKVPILKITIYTLTSYNLVIIF